MTHACTFCRSRKIKCDGHQPCQSCIRLKNSNCEYVKSITKRRRKTTNPANSLRSEINSLKQQLRLIQNNNRVNNLRENNDEYGDDTTNLSSSTDTPVSNTNEPYKNLEREELTRLLKGKPNEEILIFAKGNMILEANYIRRNFGVFSWKAYSLIDPGLRTVTNYMRFKIAQDADLKDSTSLKEISEFIKPIADLGTKLDLSQKDTINLTKSKDLENSVSETEEGTRFNTSHFKHLSGIKVGRNPSTVLNEFLIDLKCKIEDILPPKNVVWQLINMFFSDLYIMAPIIDETDLKGNLLRLFEGTDSDEKCKDLKIYNKLDFAILGTTLLILRLSYFSLLPIPWKKTKLSQDIEDLVFKYPIGMEAVSLANDCVNVFNLFCPINLTIFQLVFIVRVYSIYGPESGDGIDHGEGPLLNAMLFQLAYSLGLHRDPDNVSQNVDEKTKNLARKIWVSLVVLDLGYALEYGDPLNLSKISYDTKIPQFSNAGSNLNNIEQEKELIECYKIMDSYKLLVDFLNDLFKVDKKINILDLINRIDITKVEIFDTKSVCDLSNTFLMTLSTPSILNVRKTQIQLHFTYFLFSLYYRLFLRYEEQQEYDLAFFFLRVTLHKSFVFLMPFLFKLFDSENIEPVVEFVLAPGIQSMVHKATLTILSVMIRIKSQLANLKNNINHNNLLKEDHNYQTKFNNLNVLLGHLTKFTDYLFKVTNAYSTRYLFSWIITRINKTRYSAIIGDEFDKIFDAQQNSFVLFSDDDKVTQLIKSVELALQLRDRSKKGLSNDSIINNELRKSRGLNTSQHNETTTSSDHSLFDWIPTSNTDTPELFSLINDNLYNQSDSIDTIWMELLKGTNAQADIPQINNVFNELNGGNGFDNGSTGNNVNSMGDHVNNGNNKANNNTNPTNTVMDLLFMDQMFRS